MNSSLASTAPVSVAAAASLTPPRVKTAAALGAVFIKGVNTVNLGAHLMLLTILDEARRRRPHQPKALASSIGYDRLREYGARPRRNLRRIPAGGECLNLLARRLPGELLDRLPQVFDHQVELVLDASGFLYSDQWGPEAMARCVRDLEGLHRAGARIVLLPQAFGPFDDPACAALMRRTLNVAQFAFARDATSEAHLLTLAGEALAARVMRAPDITFGHQLRQGPVETTADTVLIVPNCRMLDKVSWPRREAYRQALQTMVQRSIASGEKVAFLIHGEPGDRAIAEDLNRTLATPLRLLEAHDPVEGKRLVAGAKYVVASRYHAVLAAFTTGVPCVALGWSHKYSELYDEFDLPQLYLSDWSESGIADALGHLASPAQRLQVKAQLEAGVNVRRRQLDHMWEGIWPLNQTTNGS